MKKLNNKGMTLVELIVSFLIVSVAMLYFFQTLRTVQDIYKKANDETQKFIDVDYVYRIVDANYQKITNNGEDLSSLDDSNFFDNIKDITKIDNDASAETGVCKVKNMTGVIALYFDFKNQNATEGYHRVLYEYTSKEIPSVIGECNNLNVLSYSEWNISSDSLVPDDAIDEESESSDSTPSEVTTTSSNSAGTTTNTTNLVHFIGGRSGNYATLIESQKNGEKIYALVDLGFGCDYGSKNDYGISEYLNRYNVKLDFLIITHAHSDHYGSKRNQATKLIDDGFTKENFYVIMKENTSAEQKLANVLKKNNIDIKSPPNYIDFGSLRLSFYNTGHYLDNYDYADTIMGSPGTTAINENSQSLVININKKDDMVKNVNYSVALFGDMSFYGARTIANSIGNVDFYAAFHHGVSCRGDCISEEDKWKNDVEENGKVLRYGTASTAKKVAVALNPKYTLISKNGDKSKAYVNALKKYTSTNILYQLEKQGEKIIYKNYKYNLKTGEITRDRTEISTDEFKNASC